MLAEMSRWGERAASTRGEGGGGGMSQRASGTSNKV